MELRRRSPGRSGGGRDQEAADGTERDADPDRPVPGLMDDLVQSLVPPSSARDRTACLRGSSAPASAYPVRNASRRGAPHSGPQEIVVLAAASGLLHTGDVVARRASAHHAARRQLGATVGDHDEEIHRVTSSCIR
jgi:hypothetical protein